MIAGRYECEGQGWKAEYWGYLASGWHQFKGKKKPICIDNTPETAHNGSPSNGHGWLNPVEGMCGALPCPPYKNALELTCVVCTK